jgi:quercetin dioxygenase-like cupin family protein
MKRNTLLATVAALAGPYADQAPAQAASDEALRITRMGSQPSLQGSVETFTGSVRIDPLFPATAPSRMSGGVVTFAPGARTAWHTHPARQALIVTAGLSWVQREGGAVEEMRSSDVVWIAPGVKHWHGAAATTGVTHIALQKHVEGQAVNWMEKVSEEQYRC